MMDKNHPDYSVDWFYDPQLLYFRKDLVSRNSLLRKTTFLEKCQELKSKSPTKHILGMHATREWQFIHSFASWLWGMGGNIYFNQFSNELEYDEHMVDAIEFYNKLLIEFSNPVEQCNNYALCSFRKMRENFIEKKDFCFFTTGPWLLKALQRKYKEKWGNFFGVTPLPTTDCGGNVAFLGGSDLCVVNKNFESEDKKRIARFLKKVVSPVNQCKFSLEMGNIPSNVEARINFSRINDERYGTEFSNFLEEVIQNDRVYPSEWEVGSNSSLLSTLFDVSQSLYASYGTGKTDSEKRNEIIISSLMKNNLKPKFEYDVAISYASEDRKWAKKLDKELNGVRTFFDMREGCHLLGKDLTKEFRRIYGGKSRLAIILISKYYPVKDWTRFESEIIIDEAKRRNKSYFVPCILDDTPVFGLSRTIGRINLKKIGAPAAAKMILEKLKEI
jgi:hypothetical protein